MPANTAMSWRLVQRAASLQSSRIATSTLRTPRLPRALSSQRSYATNPPVDRKLHNPTSLQAMPDSLEGKVISITGGASGLGLALGRLLAQRGAILSIADITEEGIDQAKVELEQLSSDSTVLAQKVDIRQKSQVDEWMGNTVSKFGRLDASANVAGVINTIEPPTALFHEEGEHGAVGWQWVFDVNVNGIANCLRSELKYLKPGASIVNVASIAGLRATPGTPHAYIASKHAVVRLTRSLAQQYGPHGIRINAVAPGAIDTPMLRRAREEGKRGKDQTKLIGGSPIERAADPEEIAKAVMYLLSNDASFITGAILRVDGGLNT
ncbi:Short-chain dehydrogenase/reductase ABA4 [Pseudocercospora fuligena]|uniref:Short-chain dehydrogenase/reductase ABA4 n=1 Tax=Pseudocercospora fuligena TaxID=685502 RepID=A0A8H6VNH0_9PEZI|nr:Short-chain dehydrogenase/reductase ABA4 [Pseudocercospora fuligena]